MKCVQKMLCNYKAFIVLIKKFIILWPYSYKILVWHAWLMLLLTNPYQLQLICSFSWSLIYNPALKKHPLKITFHFNLPKFLLKSGGSSVIQDSLSGFESFYEIEKLKVHLKQITQLI